MEQSIETKHRDMVLRLKKPGEEIQQSLTAWDCDFMHMAGCLPGEAAELYDGITDKEDEILEELGDFAFYLVACRSLLGEKWTTQAFAGKAATTSDPVKNSIQLMAISGHFWDVVKRIVIYRKPMGDPDKKYSGMPLGAVGADLLDEMERRFNSILTYCNYTLDEVLEANYTKLADADKGRYASGSYSDQQAQDRQDKGR